MKLEKWKNRIATRSDISLCVTHLTKPKKEEGQIINPVKVLIKILSDKKIVGSTTHSGFIVGKHPAVCFQDTPLYSLSQNIYYEQNETKNNTYYERKYFGFGLMFSKEYIFKKGGRPVIYDITEDAKKYIDKEEWWRIVKLDLRSKDKIVDWTHEREWRIKGDLDFEFSDVTIILPHKKVFKYFCKEFEFTFKKSPIETLSNIISLADLFY